MVGKSGGGLSYIGALKTSDIAALVINLKTLVEREKDGEAIGVHRKVREAVIT